MTDRPILFQPAMVLGMLREVETPGAGKTQTRRLPTRLLRFGKITEFGRSDTAGYDWHFRDKAKRWHDLRHDELLKVLPWQVGDRLMVRESCWLYGRWREIGTNDKGKPKRTFDLIGRTVAYDKPGEIAYWGGGPGFSHRPGIHMPRWASRLTLTVADVRVQRLQEIGEADCLAEGIFRLERKSWLNDKPLYGLRESEGHDTAVGAYNHLWRAINGDGSWAANPWVIAVTYRPELRNIDDVAKVAA